MPTWSPAPALTRSATDRCEGDARYEHADGARVSAALRAAVKWTSPCGRRVCSPGHLACARAHARASTLLPHPRHVPAGLAPRQQSLRHLSDGRGHAPRCRVSPGGPPVRRRMCERVARGSPYTYHSTPTGTGRDAPDERVAPSVLIRRSSRAQLRTRLPPRSTLANHPRLLDPVSNHPPPPPRAVKGAQRRPRLCMAFVYGVD